MKKILIVLLLSATGSLAHGVEVVGWEPGMKIESNVGDRKTGVAKSYIVEEGRIVPECGEAFTVGLKTGSAILFLTVGFLIPFACVAILWGIGKQIYKINFPSRKRRSM